MGVMSSCVGTIKLNHCSFIFENKMSTLSSVYEPCHEKTVFLSRQKQRRSNCTADQRICFRYSDSTIPLACFCDCIGRFVSLLVGNPEHWFSRVVAHMLLVHLDSGLISDFGYCVSTY